LRELELEMENRLKTKTGRGIKCRKMEEVKKGKTGVGG
jgi:hypothetical protein